MGALHDGHLSLLAAARERCDVVVMSLFVNPTQFGPGEDLDAYPRDEERDLELAEARGRRPRLRARRPTRSIPPGFATAVEVGGGLTEVLDGDPARRGPEHFRGVTTVVAKLLNAVGPDVAFFGQKDAQQAVVIRRMVRDLDFPVEIVVRAHRPRARRARDELAQRLPRARRARAGGRAEPRRCGPRGRRRRRRDATPSAALAPAAAELERRRHRARSTSRRATPRP